MAKKKMSYEQAAKFLFELAKDNDCPPNYDRACRTDGGVCDACWDRWWKKNVEEESNENNI